MTCANVTISRTEGLELYYLNFRKVRNFYKLMNRARATSSGEKCEILGRESKKDK